MQTDIAPTTPESLEKIFQKVEQESERRAEAEAIAKQPSLGDLVSSETLRGTKERRRGSISITRFGELSDGVVTKSPSSPHISSLASHSAFYQAQRNGSQGSFNSRASVDSNDVHDEDANHVTQIHQIAGRQTIATAVGSMLPRRLSRSHVPPRVITSSSGNVVVGVSVEHTVKEPVPLDEREDDNPPSAVFTGKLNTKASKQSMQSSLSGETTWKSKVGNFTKKFRRKSRQMLKEPFA